MEHLTPRETAQFLHDNPKALFIDCRSEMEFLFVGHPAGALHVSWNDGPDWEVNPHFVLRQSGQDQRHKQRKKQQSFHGAPLVLGFGLQ